MRFSFLTAVVALTTSIMSVTAKQPDCTPLGGSCKEDSDCCDLIPAQLGLGTICSQSDDVSIFTLKPKLVVSSTTSPPYNWN
ncbi:hypothetical protein BDR04DRAFT_1099900, partial [Suillus decipiens]